MLNPDEMNEDVVTTLIDFIVGNSRMNKAFSLRAPNTFTACVDL